MVTSTSLKNIQTSQCHAVTIRLDNNISKICSQEFQFHFHLKACLLLKFHKHNLVDNKNMIIKLHNQIVYQIA